MPTYSLPPVLPRTLKINKVEYKMPQWLNEGSSIFLPCVNTKKTFEAVKAHYAPCEWVLRYEERAEMGILGIRVWRVE